LTVGSLFSGIGGFDLGLERAGMRTVWFCECDPFCQRVLARHWPGVPCYPDVRQLRGADVEPVDVLAGGFPCQDISSAGSRAGIDGARSGLWREYARLVGEVRPRYVLVENVANLLVRGFGRVLADLAAIGYDAEWDCLPASAFGAPHRRDRVWLVAYPHREGEHAGALDAEVGRAPQPLADAGGERWEWGSRVEGDGRHAPFGRQESDHIGDGSGVADADGERWNGRTGNVAQADGRGEPEDGDWWAVEPDVGRVAHGVPARMDRLRSLGNALVPQIAEWIGRRIIDREKAHAH
jgi:DNA (cytosine-5)-methyltransferase 1